MWTLYQRSITGPATEAQKMKGWTAPSFSETVTSGKVGTHGITETAPR